MSEITAIKEKTPADIFIQGQIEKVDTWQDVVNYILSENEVHTGQYVLSSFDDINQAGYTSMHASTGNELNYRPECTDIDYDSPQYYHNEFNYRLNVFRTHTQQALSALTGKISLTDVDITILTKINSEPMLVCDMPIRLDKVPVSKSSELLAFFPNGYFSCDFNTFENKALSEHLSHHFNYQLISIGASVLAFARKEPLKADEADKLALQFIDIFEIEDTASLDKLKALWQQHNFLFMPYVESLDHYDGILES